MARCSLILSNVEKSLDNHECGHKGKFNFGCLSQKCFPLHYYSCGQWHDLKSTEILINDVWSLGEKRAIMARY